MCKKDCQRNNDNINNNAQKEYVALEIKWSKISENSKLVTKDYLNRQHWIRKEIHWEFYKRLKFQHIDKLHIYKPESVQEKEIHKMP